MRSLQYRTRAICSWVLEADDLHIPDTSSRKVSYRIDSAISIYVRVLSLLGRIQEIYW